VSKWDSDSSEKHVGWAGLGWLADLSLSDGSQWWCGWVGRGRN
jgi:hypothetical protein